MSNDFPFSLKVLDTDYDNYACMLACGEKMGFKAEFGTVMSRMPVMPLGAVERCQQMVKSFEIETFNNLMEMPHNQVGW